MASDNETNVICKVNDLEELECREIEWRRAGAHGETGFIVKKNGEIHAYVNSCPHSGAPLNWQKNQFLDIFKTHILCTIHGARFQISDGLCIEGPCVGQRLKKLNATIHNESICRAAPTELNPNQCINRTIQDTGKSH